GFILLHTPPGLRKSGTPDSVEMPAPVNTTMRRASAISRARSAREPASDMARSSPQAGGLRQGSGDERRQAAGHRMELGLGAIRMAERAALLAVERPERRRLAEQVGLHRQMIADPDHALDLDRQEVGQTPVGRPVHLALQADDPVFDLDDDAAGVEQPILRQAFTHRLM